MISKFLDYVEIRTKITSLFAFAMSIGFLLYNKYSIDLGLTLIFFISMFIFDLATTAINNYIDTKTNHQVLQFERKQALHIIYVLLGISTALGIVLVIKTDILVLVIGGLCFLCGISYTFGPTPISRMPLGEVISGFFYGFMIPFLIFYINMPLDALVDISLSWTMVSMNISVVPILVICVFAIIPFCCTANIMLANNICDVEKDILVKRYTLPYYIGKKALILFSGLYYLCYVGIIVLVVLGYLHPISLVSILTIYLVQKNINVFKKKQLKSETFIISIKNYVIIMGVNTLLIYIGIFL